VHFGQDAPADEVEVYPSADIGLDFALDPGRNFVIRVATSLGDRQALAVGLNLGGSRAGR
jgi:serine acetyltransferase